MNRSEGAAAIPRAYAAFLGVMAVGLFLVWLLTPIILPSTVTAVNLMTLPPVVVGLVVALALYLTGGPSRRRAVESGVFCLLAAWLLGNLALIEWGVSSFQAGAAGPLAAWLPMLYLFAFLSFKERGGLIAAGAVYLGVVFVTVLAFARHTIPLTGTRTALVFVITGLVYVLMILALIRTFKRYGQRIEAETVSRFAYVDPLTGLPNRRFLGERLEESLALAAQEGFKVAIAFVDLDGYKAVNDHFGHSVGDEVLRRIAERLNEQRRMRDVVARYGGDEFVVVMERVTPETAVKSVEAMLAAVRAPIEGLADGPIQVGGSAGIGIYPDDGVSAERLIQKADEAMYAAKRKRAGAGSGWSGSKSPA
ncbi:MAG TPA: GGDEF domain-containing protein [Limnochordia bacterium]|nr:GGDEF domain-containing protein [Limnochordia bacterium]